MRTSGAEIAHSLPASGPRFLRIRGDGMQLLKGIGVALIVLWLVLWLAVKITFAAVHLLLLIGLALLVYGFVKSRV
jgi:Flp pilus assembly protein TadB